MLEQNTNTMPWFNLNISRIPISGALRSTVGLVLHVQASKEIEQYFCKLSEGEKVNIDKFRGYNWYNLDPKNELIIQAYDIVSGIINNNKFTIDGLGYPMTVEKEQIASNFDHLLKDGGRIIEVANISMLRLVGISNPGGIRFGLAGVYSKNAIRHMFESCMANVKGFIEEYLVPVNVNLRITQTNL